VDVAGLASGAGEVDRVLACGQGAKADDLLHRARLVLEDQASVGLESAGEMEPWVARDRGIAGIGSKGDGAADDSPARGIDARNNIARMTTTKLVGTGSFKS
jgi:hypothetical protein